MDNVPGIFFVMLTSYRVGEEMERVQYGKIGIGETGELSTGCEEGYG